MISAMKKRPIVWQEAFDGRDKVRQMKTEFDSEDM